MLSIAVSILLLCPAYAAAGTVAAVKSVDIKPYKRAIKGFKEVVPYEVREYVLRYRGMSGQNLEKQLLLIKSDQTELVFTLGAEALEAIKREFSDVPVIFSFVLHPDHVIGGDWTEQHPNLWGISMNIPPEEQFKVLQQAVPEAKRIGVVYDPEKTGQLVAEAEASAARLGMTLVTHKISSSEEAIDAIDRLKGRADVVWMVPDTTAITRESMKYMLLFSFRNGLPLIGISEKYVKNGALFALSFDSEDVGRQAGEMAEKILIGNEKSGHGLHLPRRLKLSINAKTAEKIGLAIPERLIQMADKVY